MTTFNQRTRSYTTADPKCFLSDKEKEVAQKLLDQCADKPIRKITAKDFENVKPRPFQVWVDRPKEIRYPDDPHVEHKP